MRNLKRVLSRALAMVMVLGVMIISGSAASKDFVDADKIARKIDKIEEFKATIDGESLYKMEGEKSSLSGRFFPGNSLGGKRVWDDRECCSCL